MRGALALVLFASTAAADGPQLLRTQAEIDALLGDGAAYCCALSPFDTVCAQPDEDPGVVVTLEDKENAAPTHRVHPDLAASLGGAPLAGLPSCVPLSPSAPAAQD